MSVIQAVHVGARIRLARESAGLSPEELADAIGMSEPAVRAWEGGRRNPRKEPLEAIAAATDRTLAWFFDTEDFGVSADTVRVLEEGAAVLASTARPLGLLNELLEEDRRGDASEAEALRRTARCAFEDWLEARMRREGGSEDEDVRDEGAGVAAAGAGDDAGAADVGAAGASRDDLGGVSLRG